MRLFVALDIDEAIQQRLDDYIRTLQPRLPGVRFVRSSNYHITLKFLGEVSSPLAVQQELREIRSEAFEITVRGVGFFPDSRAPRVFWAGVNAPLVSGLAHQVEEVLSEFGFRAEGEFHPQLTLARKGSGRPRPTRGERSPDACAQLAGIVASRPAPEFGTMTARAFFLYESRLASGGPSYIKLESYQLAR